MTLQETKWTLPTPDGKTIYGVLNTSGHADNAVFIVHGLTGHMYEYQFKRAADYFAGQGYDVYRFNLYDGEDNARQLVDCTIATHAEDLKTVLAAYAGNYNKTFLIGHSYGGTTVMLANPANIIATSLWDPSFDLNKIDEEFSDQYKPLTGMYQVNWGISYLIGQEMKKEAEDLDEDACIQLAKQAAFPVQVIHAGDGYYITKPYSYHSFGHAQNRRDIVKGTQHCFHEGTTADDLLAKTHAWFKEWQ